MNQRMQGLLKLIGGGFVFALAYAYVASKGLNTSSVPGGPFGLIGICAPGAFALVGLIEIVTGEPFTKLAESWDRLQGWQRGVLGVLIVAVSIVLLFGGIILFA